MGYETFVYTFAAPNTTTATEEKASEYTSIFNIQNADDIIAELPLTDWSFRKYGITKTLSLKIFYVIK